MDLKRPWKEFKGFALKGNVIDLAVAVVIGGAFGKVVDSLVKNIVMPLISYIVPTEGGYRLWKIGRVEIGAFLSEVVNFAVIAAALFFVLVKVIGTVQRVAFDHHEEEPSTKECPFCLSVIPYRARKCGHCTADLPQGETSVTSQNPVSSPRASEPRTPQGQ
jgi:large conductance mechanosensitive channel